MKRCKFIYKDGKKCYSTYVIEDGFCFNHSPSKGEKLKAIKKEKQALAKEFKLPSPNPMKQIRLNCMDCCGDRVKAVKFCASVNCKLWYLRFGC